MKTALISIVWRVERPEHALDLLPEEAVRLQFESHRTTTFLACTAAAKPRVHRRAYYSIAAHHTCHQAHALASCEHGLFCRCPAEPGQAAAHSTTSAKNAQTCFNSCQSHCSKTKMRYRLACFVKSRSNLSQFAAGRVVRGAGVCGNCLGFLSAAGASRLPWRHAHGICTTLLSVEYLNSFQVHVGRVTGWTGPLWRGWCR